MDKLTKVTLAVGILAVVMGSVGFTILVNSRIRRTQAFNQPIIQAKKGSLLRGAIVVYHGNDRTVHMIENIMKEFGASSEKGDYFIDINVDTSYRWVNGKVIVLRRDHQIVGVVNYVNGSDEELKHDIACWAIRYKKSIKSVRASARGLTSRIECKLSS